MKYGERLGDEADRQGRRRTQANPTSLEAREFGQLASSRLRVRQHPARERQERLSGNSQSASRACAMEQGSAQVLLERGDLPAEGGLREVQAIGRPGEVSELGDRDERMQLLEVHVHRLLLSL